MFKNNHEVRWGKIKLPSLLVGLLALTLIVTITALMSVSIHEQQRTLTNAALQRNFEGARNLAISVHTIKDLMFRELESTSRYLADAQIRIEEQPGLLGALLTGGKLFNEAVLADASGVVKAATPESGYKVGERLDAGRAEKPFREEVPHLSDPVQSSDGGRTVLAFHPLPLSGEGQSPSYWIAGIIQMENNNVFTDLFEHAMRSTSGSFAYMVDSHGELLLNPAPERTGEILPARTVHDSFGRGGVRSAVLANHQGEEMLAGYLRIEGLDFGIVFQSPASHIEGAKAGIIRKQLSWSLPIIAGILVLSVWIALKLSAPFTALTKTARRISAGERIEQPPFDGHWNYEAHYLARAMMRAVQDLQHQADISSLQARTDKLTGLANREGLEEWLFALEPSGRYALLVIDIDHFKRINDQYGHNKGDETLIHLADILKSQCREGDLICRLGGEEFVVAVALQRQQIGASLAERIRRKVESTAGPIGRPITVSIGVAYCPEHGTTFDEVFKRADEALYEAKRAGHNRAMAST